MLTPPMPPETKRRIRVVVRIVFPKKRVCLYPVSLFFISFVLYLDEHKIRAAPCGKKRKRIAWRINPNRIAQGRRAALGLFYGGNFG
jgi:hypothetical protein